MPYLHALRFALSNPADAFGFTVVVSGTGALTIWQLGKPDAADVFARAAAAAVLGHAPRLGSRRGGPGALGADAGA